MNKSVRADELLRQWLSSSGTSQSELAETLGVSRAAVSKMAAGTMTPSLVRAKEIDKLSQGAVPATAWPRRPMPAPLTKGARVIQNAAKKFDGSISMLAREKGLPERSLYRWASSQNGPRSWALAELNAALQTNLKPSDFQVTA